MPKFCKELIGEAQHAEVCTSLPQTSNIVMATFISPINIALIKYWGKKDEINNVPLNDSLSLTLDTNDLSTITTVAISPKFKSDQMWLNGSELDINSTPRVARLLKHFRNLSNEHENGDMTMEIKSSQISPLPKRLRYVVDKQWHVHICSQNNFPTAAGLASSASGYAALVLALNEVYNGDCDEHETHLLKDEQGVLIRERYLVKELEALSRCARLGSGSACRSLFGPVSLWQAGTCDVDSLARPIIPTLDMEDVRVLILIVNGGIKGVPSTEGMARSVATSSLLTHRVQNVVGQRMKEAVDCLQGSRRHHNSKRGREESDGARWRLFELIMKESDQLHAICRDTYPPITYMTDISNMIVSLVHAYNRTTTSSLQPQHGHNSSPQSGNKVAYSFDAGPNAFLFLQETDVAAMLSIIKHYFPPQPQLRAKLSDTENTLPQMSNETSRTLTEMYEQLGTSVNIVPNAISDIVFTRPGDGPIQLLSAAHHPDSLLDINGYPKILKNQI